MSAVAMQLNRSAKAVQGLERIGAHYAPAGNIKARVRAAHLHTGLPYSRTRELWYGRARRIADAELAAIEAALPPDTAEFSLAFVRSVETRVAALLEELAAVRARCEAELAARADRSAGTQAADGGGDAVDRP
ncbi:hypothetical protein [uncultured Methylobacterium sp.]|uniref:hypothetical protein n=1 Tax=uncultured Methylobacterium sp. TaxID=157278 RepID=UPI0035CA804F